MHPQGPASSVELWIFFDVPSAKIKSIFSFFYVYEVVKTNKHVSAES